jgi:hypothetical protein
MSLTIHICSNETDADVVINTVKRNLKNQNVQAEKLILPDIQINDHSADVENPELLNQGKICVVFRDL